MGSQINLIVLILLADWVRLGWVGEQREEGAGDETLDDDLSLFQSGRTDRFRQARSKKCRALIGKNWDLTRPSLILYS